MRTSLVGMIKAQDKTNLELAAQILLYRGHSMLRVRRFLDYVLKDLGKVVCNFYVEEGEFIHIDTTRLHGPYDAEQLYKMNFLYGGKIQELSVPAITELELEGAL